jgi:hypothetical protein
MKDDEKALVLKGYRCSPPSVAVDWATAAWMKEQLPWLEQNESSNDCCRCV